MSFWTEKFTFGNQVVPRFTVAPLDGVTDSPLRQMVREYSPEVLMYTEMRHIASVANAKLKALFAYKPIEQPLAYQISANRLQWMHEAIEKIIAYGFCEINLNMGCPARQVIGSGSGSALMADIPRYKEIVSNLIRIIDGRLPFTIKIRAGFKQPNALEVAQIAEDLGVAGIIIHPRLQTGGFTAPLNYDLVAQIKKNVSLPLMFSGNINSFKRAEKVYERTGVDGFMIGRAVWGCPWKIKEIMEHAKGNEFAISTKEALSCAIKHLAHSVDLYGPRGVHHFKKQLPQYIRGVPDASQLRATMLRLQTAEEMTQQLIDLQKSDFIAIE